MLEVPHNKTLRANEKGGLFLVPLIFKQKMLPTFLLKTEREKKKKSSKQHKGAEDDTSGSERDSLSLSGLLQLWAKFPRDSPSSEAGAQAVNQE